MQPKLKVEYLPTEDLAAYANNTRVHSDEQVDEIVASIDQFKFSDPIGVWTNPDGVLEVVEGHGRLMAARRLGIEQVPVIRLDHLDDDAAERNAEAARKKDENVRNAELERLRNAVENPSVQVGDGGVVIWRLSEREREIASQLGRKSDDATWAERQ